MKFNVYRRTPGKPMVWNLESAKAFCEQCKNHFEVRTERDHYIIIKGDYVKCVTREKIGYIGVDLVTDEYHGEEAVKMVYKMRKHINARFTEV